MFPDKQWNYAQVADQIEQDILNEKQKLKPQYEDEDLLVDVYVGRSTTAKVALDVRVKSIVNGLATREEIYKWVPTMLHQDLLLIKILKK